MDGIFYRIDHAARASLPVISCFILILLTFAPWPPLIKSFLQALPLVLLCFWVMHRPDLFKTHWSFLLGLLYDMLAGQVIGLTALSFLVADVVLRSQRGFFRNYSFLAGWMAASFVIAGVSLIPWAMASTFSGELRELSPTGIRIAFSVLLFPVIAGTLQRLSPLPREGF